MTEPPTEFDLPEEGAADQALTEYARVTDEAPMPGFADWVVRSVESEATPGRGRLASLGLLSPTRGPYRTAIQAAAVVLIVVAGITSAVAVVQIGSLLPNTVGTPSVPSAEPLPSPSVSPSEESTPAPSSTEAPDPSRESIASATPEESENESETPEPN